MEYPSITLGTCLAHSGPADGRGSAHSCGLLPRGCEEVLSARLRHWNDFNVFGSLRITRHTNRYALSRQQHSANPLLTFHLTRGNLAQMVFWVFVHHPHFSTTLAMRLYASPHHLKIQFECATQKCTYQLRNFVHQRSSPHAPERPERRKA